MNLNLLKKTVNDIEISCEEVGMAVANADSHQQKTVLLAMAAACERMSRTGGSWALQCRAIVDGVHGRWSMTAEERQRVASMLSVLLDHLNEPVAGGNES